MGFIRAVCAATAFTAPMCTHTYAPRFYGFRGECDAVNATGRGALDISLILSSLFFSFSHFSKSYTYTRRGVACARVHIVDSSDGDSKNFLPACNYL